MWQKSQYKYLMDGKELDLETIKKEWLKLLKLVKDKKINVYALFCWRKFIVLKTTIYLLVAKDGYGLSRDKVLVNLTIRSLLEQIVSSYFNKKI